MARVFQNQECDLPIVVMKGTTVQYLIPAPVDRTSASAWMYKHLWITSKNMLSSSMTKVAGKSKLRLVVKSSMHPYPGNWVAIGHV